MLRALLLLTFLPLTVNAMAQQTPPQNPAGSDLLPFKAVETSLPNGLKVIVVPTGFPNLVSLQIPVQTGSRNEVEPGKSGFAHFFEHMMFRGTKQYPPEKYEGVMTRAGARSNAYTTDDFTNYHTTFSKDDLEQILAVEADRFQHLEYPEAAFRTESRAVLGEYNKNSADPLTKLIEVQRDHAFTTHTYRHTTMGFLKDIEDMPNQFAYSRQFFDRWYRPEYTTLIIAGDVDPAKVLPLVEKYWGGWKRGSFTVEIPKEPEPKAPVYAHVPWPTATLPWVTVAFHGPAFSETNREYAALDLLMDLEFGETSALYKKLVQTDQVVDQLFPYVPANTDPSLATVGARLKRPEDAIVVRDAILRTFADARTAPIDPARLRDAKSNARYGLVRGLDNTETIAGVLARYVRYRRSFETLNSYYRLIDSLTPDDLLAAARRFFTDNRLVVTTLSKEALPAGIETAPGLASFAVAAAPAQLTMVRQPSPLPLINVQLRFGVGSSQDPPGKEGLAALTAALIADSGSEEMTLDEIRRALFPMAASFSESTDRDVTTFTAVVHKEKWDAFAPIAFRMLTMPGFRESDFQRIKTQQLNALVQDLRANNEEELGKERLQSNVFIGTHYGHPVLGTVAGLGAITLEDVKTYARQAFNRANLVVGVAGDASDAVIEQLRTELGRLPERGLVRDTTPVPGMSPKGIEVELVQKETRAAAISFGFPIDVTRSHPDFPALSVARAWLGEHRSSMSHLYQRIRELRGMNYGDYAYIEAFPGGMYSFFPPTGVPRRTQLFEVWIRPVKPENAHFALRAALFELDKLVKNGLSKEDFENVRQYLMKNVYVVAATQGRQLGYALDQRWYGLPDYTTFMRDALSKLTLDDVNRAIRKHLRATDLSVVIVTQDADALRKALLADAVSTITYESPKPADVLKEDKVIGALKLNLKPDSVRITKVEDVFAK